MCVFVCVAVSQNDVARDMTPVDTGTDHVTPSHHDVIDDSDVMRLTSFGNATGDSISDSDSGGVIEMNVDETYAEHHLSCHGDGVTSQAGSEHATDKINSVNQQVW